MAFEYLIEKISKATITAEPFPHIQINDFFSPEHFAALTSTPEIALSNLKSDEHLFETLFNAGWKIISFPGCITNHKTYIDWHKDKRGKVLNNTACEGFGVTLRLVAPRSTILNEISEFMATRPFQEAMAVKFNIPMDKVYYDGGVQKYLDGYEISPHPDIRRKALTYMVNVNPAKNSEALEHHTHYLTFKKEYEYVETYWDGDATRERCWVPWSWCETHKEQRENNSIVIFSPGNRTMHGVKASYDHLANQRTQLYGNLWYSEDPALQLVEWEDLVIHPGRHKRPTQSASLTDILRATVPPSVKSLIKRHVLGRGDEHESKFIATRNKGGY